MYPWTTEEIDNTQYLKIVLIELLLYLYRYTTKVCHTYIYRVYQTQIVSNRASVGQYDDV